MKSHPEIERLKQYLIDFKIDIRKTKSLDKNNHIFWVQYTINDDCWDILIDDEFNHFSEQNPLINFYLTLVALEEYIESDDYLAWCKLYNLDASNMIWLNYYKSLEKTCKQIERVLGKIDSEISSFDYTLQTGLGKALSEYTGI